MKTHLLISSYAVMALVQDLMEYFSILQTGVPICNSCLFQTASTFLSYQSHLSGIEDFTPLLEFSLSKFHSLTYKGFFPLIHACILCLVPLLTQTASLSHVIRGTFSLHVCLPFHIVSSL